MSVKKNTKQVVLEGGLHATEGELHEVEDELHDFEARQSVVTRTLQMIVYPAMIAFIVLSAYGFYLIQSLTTDVHRLTETISNMSDTVHSNMNNISNVMDKMSGHMGSLVLTTGEMNQSVLGMSNSTRQMSTDVNQMNASTQNMAVSTYNMQRDMWSMNRNISKPLKMFNKFMPFGGSDQPPPYTMPPAQLMPYYSNAYYNNGWYYSAQPSVVPALGGVAPQAVPATVPEPAADVQPPLQQQPAHTVDDSQSMQALSAQSLASRQ